MELLNSFVQHETVYENSTKTIWSQGQFSFNKNWK